MSEDRVVTVPLGHRPPRVLMLLTAATLVLSLFAPSARADDAQVTVVAPGGAQQTLSLDALVGQEDVQGTYALRSAAGESVQTVTGFSLAAILGAAGADPYGFSYLEAQRPAGGSVLLSRHQALDPGVFADGPPVVYATATGTAFLRPNSGPEDLNATDSFEAAQGVTLVLHKGSPLQVRAKASTLRTRPGREVSFTAVVDRAGAGEQLTYSWYFDDGHSASGTSVSHSFARRGNYDVVVGVTTPGDSAGASAVVAVQVGAPLAGPNRKGGGRNRNAEAPDHGAAGGTGGEDGPTGSSPAGSGGSSVGGSPPDTRPTAALSVRRGTTDAALHEAAAGQRIVGELVNATATAPSDAAKPVAARRGHLENDGGRAGLPEAALGLLVTAGLLGAGALTEARSLLR